MIFLWLPLLHARKTTATNFAIYLWIHLARKFNLAASIWKARKFDFHFESKRQTQIAILCCLPHPSPVAFNIDLKYNGGGRGGREKRYFQVITTCVWRAKPPAYVSWDYTLRLRRGRDKSLFNVKRNIFIFQFCLSANVNFPIVLRWLCKCFFRLFTFFDILFFFSWYLGSLSTFPLPIFRYVHAFASRLVFYFFGKKRWQCLMFHISEYSGQFTKS